MRAAVTALGLCIVATPVAARSDGPAWFPDRPPAWSEHDDGDVPRAPEPTHLEDLDTTLLLRDSLAGEVDRVLSRDGGRPAEDVNAVDEVPCSTWFCARNHLRALTLDEAAAGPPAPDPALPLRIVKGKDVGASPGFQVVDARGRKFMLKFDPAGRIGLTTGAEMIGGRIFHAAGYNVPGSRVLDLGPKDLVLDPHATFNLFKVQKRPLTEPRVRELLADVARTPDGRIRGGVVPWIEGKILGGFDMRGRRDDDPNDRIEHQNRRSLRASWLLFDWISEVDPSSINTLDSYVQVEDRPFGQLGQIRHFVRHYIFDFGATLGSATTRPKGPHEGGEYVIEVGRTLGAMASLGFYRRPFQDARSDWQETVSAYPSVGWFPAEEYDPDQFRPNRKVPAHMRRTDRDLYWGAKVVTSFSDAQIAAIVATARLPEKDGAYVQHALQVRRDAIGRRYLRRMSAVENPAMAQAGEGDGAGAGAAVCFDDLAIGHGYARVAEVRYDVDVGDGRGNRLVAGQRPAAGPRTCVSIGAARADSGYRIVKITSHLDGGGAEPAQVAKPSRIHLRWRASERRFAVVGLERDE
jgi:hypothetical protein